MNDQFHAQLSALHDGELSELELRGLLKQLHNCTDAERAETLHKWGRYQVIAEALADERGSCTASAGFAAAVGRAIEQEPATSQAPTSAPLQEHAENAQATPLWSRFAVAASVALAVVVGVQQYQLNTASEIGAAEASFAKASAVEATQAAQVASAPATQQVLATAARDTQQQQADALRAQRRLHEYMLEHANHAARQNGQGIAPFARVANFEVEVK